MLARARSDWRLARLLTYIYRCLPHIATSDSSKAAPWRRWSSTPRTAHVSELGRRGRLVGDTLLLPRSVRGPGFGKAERLQSQRCEARDVNAKALGHRPGSEPTGNQSQSQQVLEEKTGYKVNRRISGFKLQERALKDTAKFPKVSDQAYHEWTVSTGPISD